MEQSLDHLLEGKARRTFRENIVAGHYGVATDSLCGNSSGYLINCTFKNRKYRILVSGTKKYLEFASFIICGSVILGVCVVYYLR